MHTPKVIIHRLHTPGQRSLPRRRRLAGGLLQTVAALAGFAVLIVVLSAA